MMTCDWCKKEFPEDARACVESGFDAVWETEDGKPWEEEEPPPLTAEAREHLKADMGLNDAELDRLLTTGTVDGLGAIVCLECQSESD